MKNKILLVTMFALLSFALTAPNAHAGDQGYSKIVNHLKTKYRAKKVGIPMMWLARFAVKMVRPAGVKSFSLTMFENLSVSRETLDTEMQSVMRNSLDKNWSPIFRVRSRGGQQAYMYMSEAGANVKIMLVTIDANNQAAVIRAKFSPEKLAEFINNPKIFGVSLGDNEAQTNKDSAQTQ